MDPNKNFAQATVSTGYAAAAVTVVVSSGHAARFPVAVTGDAATHFNAVWWNATDYPNPADDPSVEIVRVTNISSDTLTVTRAQEGTSATDKNTSARTYQLAAMFTLKSWDDIQYRLPAEYAGDPNGNVDGDKMRWCLDTVAGLAYYKTTARGTLTGWV